MAKFKVGDRVREGVITDLPDQDGDGMQRYEILRDDGRTIDAWEYEIQREPMNKSIKSLRAKYKVGDLVRTYSGQTGRILEDMNDVLGAEDGEILYKVELSDKSTDEVWEDELTKISQSGVKSIKSLRAKYSKTFAVGDLVRTADDVMDVSPQFRGKEGKITRIEGGSYDVVFADGTDVEFFETELTKISQSGVKSIKSLRAKYSKGFVPVKGQSAWVIWNGEEYWSPSGWVEEGSDKAQYFLDRSAAYVIVEDLRDQGNSSKFLKVIQVVG